MARSKLYNATTLQLNIPRITVWNAILRTAYDNGDDHLLQAVICNDVICPLLEIFQNVLRRSLLATRDASASAAAAASAVAFYPHETLQLPPPLSPPNSSFLCNDQLFSYPENASQHGNPL